MPYVVDGGRCWMKRESVMATGPSHFLTVAICRYFIDNSDQDGKSD